MKVWIGLIEDEPVCVTEQLKIVDTSVTTYHVYKLNKYNSLEKEYNYL